MRFTFTLLFILAGICLQAQQKQSAVFYFDFGSASLTSASRQEMDAMIKTLETKKNSSITINGYTDLAGTEEYNKTLSERRSATVAQLLKFFLHDSVSFSINGYGASNLLTDKPENQFLNRRVEIIIETHNTVAATAAADTVSVVEVSPFQEDVQTQYFTINADDTIQISAKEGTYIRIEPGSLQNKKGGLIHGSAQLAIKEYYQPSQIMLAGMHSVSPEGLLQSGGMFYITVVQGSDTMATTTKMPVKIKLPKLYNELDSMNVYTSPNGRDAAGWNNTGRLFRPIYGGWAQPYILALSDMPTRQDAFFTNLPMDRKYEEDKYCTAYPVFRMGKKLIREFRYRPLAKKIHTNYLKRDSVTVIITAHIQYRHRGYRLLRKRTLDTSYAINYAKPEYEAFAASLNWINCDRFYKNNNNVDFYVNTAGFKGLSVMVYFKGLHAFMPAQAFKDKYQVAGVPSDMPVTVIAVGKKGDDFYFGKQRFLTQKSQQAEVNAAKMTEEDFRKEMKNL